MARSPRGVIYRKNVVQIANEQSAIRHFGPENGATGMWPANPIANCNHLGEPTCMLASANQPDEKRANRGIAGSPPELRLSETRDGLRNCCRFGIVSRPPGRCPSPPSTHSTPVHQNAGFLPRHINHLRTTIPHRPRSAHLQSNQMNRALPCAEEPRRKNLTAARR